VALDLAKVPGLDPADIQRLVQLNTQVVAHGCLCGVLQFPADRNSVYYPVYMTSMLSGSVGPLSAR